MTHDDWTTRQKLAAYLPPSRRLFEGPTVPRPVAGRVVAPAAPALPAVPTRPSVWLSRLSMGVSAAVFGLVAVKCFVWGYGAEGGVAVAFYLGAALASVLAGLAFGVAITAGE